MADRFQPFFLTVLALSLLALGWFVSAGPGEEVPQEAASAPASEPVDLPEVLVDLPVVILDLEEDLPADDAVYSTGGADLIYGCRLSKASLEEEGGGVATEASVGDALRWLWAHQHKDGRWGASSWVEVCGHSDGPCDGPGFNQGSPSFDVGVTSLALLAFLGHWHTHRFGAHKPTVRRGLRWLRSQQGGDGSFGVVGGAGLANHALATLALCEAYALTRDFTLRRAATEAVAYCLEAQNPGRGWDARFQGGDDDPFVTRWSVLALEAARAGGVEVPEEVFEGAVGGGGDVSGVARSVLRGLSSGQPRGAEEAQRGSEALRSCLPSWDDPVVDFEAWHHGSYAQFQMGGDCWEEWNEAMVAALVPRQRRGGCAAGSWDPVGVRCAEGGRVYATALNALTLEVYYRFERTR